MAAVSTGPLRPNGDTTSDLTASAAVLRAGLAMSGLDLQTLWVDYTALGGTMSPAELTEALRGERTVSDYEHDVLAQALNDDFTGRGHNHPVPYSEDLDNPGPHPAHGTQHR
jgi:hypothetical protein